MNVTRAIDVDSETTVALPYKIATLFAFACLLCVWCVLILRLAEDDEFVARSRHRGVLRIAASCDDVARYAWNACVEVRDESALAAAATNSTGFAPVLTEEGSGADERVLPPGLN